MAYTLDQSVRVFGGEKRLSNDDIGEVFAALDFEGEYVIVLQDVHYSDNAGVTLFSPKVRQAIEACDPKPKAILINGDLFTGLSESFGYTVQSFFDAEADAFADEFGLTVGSDPIDGITIADVPVYFTTGNHDSKYSEGQPFDSADDLGAALLAKFPGTTIRHSGTVGGVPYYMLPANNGGYIRQDDIDWIRAAVATDSDSTETIVFFHQPGFGISGERYARRMFREVMSAGPSKDYWFFAGHVHQNTQSLHSHAGATVIRTQVAATGEGNFTPEANDPAPSAMAICCEDGEVKHRLSLMKGVWQRVADLDRSGSATALPGDFDTITPLTHYEHGQFDPTSIYQDYQISGLTYYRETGPWLYLAGDMTLRVALNPTATHFYILATSADAATVNANIDFEMSNDGVSWTSVSWVEPDAGDIVSIEIPAPLTGSNKDFWWRSTVTGTRGTANIRWSGFGFHSP